MLYLLFTILKSRFTIHSLLGRDRGCSLHRVAKQLQDLCLLALYDLILVPIVRRHMLPPLFLVAAVVLLRQLLLGCLV